MARVLPLLVLAASLDATPVAAGPRLRATDVERRAGDTELRRGETSEAEPRARPAPGTVDRVVSRAPRAQRAGLQELGRSIGRNGELTASDRRRWSALVEQAARADGPLDLDALVETVMEQARREAALQEVGEDAQLANIDLQNALQRHQQAQQMLSHLAKALHRTALDVIRKLDD